MRYVPLALVIVAAAILLWHGPIVQFADYHMFADGRVWLGIPNAVDVLSNLGFLGVGIWGFWHLWPLRSTPALSQSWPGHSVFLVALIMTAAGSSFYHLMPDNARLVWDRLPISLACAGLLQGFRAEAQGATHPIRESFIFIAAAILSVGWWVVTDQNGAGDLRPYLLLQTAPLVLIPLWQMIYAASMADRRLTLIAILLYVLAKIAELLDYQIFAILNFISGHSLKHLLAAAAAYLLVQRLLYYRVGTGVSPR